jgi:hypothetical protein
MPLPVERLVLGEYLPDLPAVSNPGLVSAKNSIPVTTGYSGIRSPSAFSEFNALPLRPRGSVSLVDKAGNPYNFCGTETKLYRLSSETADVTRSVGGNYNAIDNKRWSFSVFGDIVIACNPNDETQFYTVNSSSNFASLERDGRKAPRAAHSAVVGSFLMLGNTFDTTNGTGENAIHWSALGDPFNWPETGTSAAVAVQSDRQVLEGSGGAVQAVVSGSEVAAIFQERAIWRADYRGGDVVFGLTKVDPLRGLLVPGLAVPFGRSVFYLSEEGFQLFDYTNSRPIGRGRVDKSFFQDLDQSKLELVSAAADPDNQRIWVAYPGAGSTTSANKVLIYDWGLDRWSHAEFDLSLICEVVPGADSSLEATVTTEDPSSVDSAGAVSFDARVSGFGARRLGCFNSSNQICDFSGDFFDSVFETGKREFGSGVRSTVLSARAIAETLNPTIQIASHPSSVETSNFKLPVSVNKDNLFSLRSSGMFHSLRLNMSGGFTNAIGIDVFFRRSGIR